MSTVTGNLANPGDLVILQVPPDTQSITVQLANPVSATIVVEDSFDQVNYQTVATLDNPAIVNFPIGAASNSEQVQVFRVRAIAISGTVAVTLIPYPASTSITTIVGSLQATLVNLPPNAAEEHGGNLDAINDILQNLLSSQQDINDRLDKFIENNSPNVTVTGSVLATVGNFPPTTLAPNAAQETGGNLAAIVQSNTLLTQQLQFQQALVDLLGAILSNLRLLNLNTASCIPGAETSADSLTTDPMYS